MAKFAGMLWLALLAFGLPEVFAGSGAGWIFDPLFFLFTIPLYALHFRLLCHIAVVSGRVGWRSPQAAMPCWPT